MDRAESPSSSSGSGDLKDPNAATPTRGFRLPLPPQRDTLLLMGVLDAARSGKYPECALLIELAAADGGTVDSESFPLHHTRPQSATSASALTLALGLRPDSPVHVLEKSKRNPFSGMITVGRAPNNDLILTDSSISKFHAYFRATPKDGLSLYDVGSTNGTKVEDKPIKVDGVPLATLARILIGDKPFVFIARADVKAWLTAQIVEVRSGPRPSRPR